MAQDDERTDLDLVAAANRGDPGAFEGLYRRYRDWVVSLAWRFTGNRADALDVMQETFTYLLRKFPSRGATGRVPPFRLTAKMKTFLYPAVRNLSIAARRKRDRHFTDDDLLAEVPAADSPRRTRRDELAHVLRTLKPIHREVVLMRFVDDMMLEEIATALDVPVGTVKSRLHAALNTLRDDPRTREYFEPP
jgi:RNA polymerase sigma-70 factor (ECF subfamily)